jgi:drug/metabolite transporter (DMT)-like permease
MIFWGMSFVWSAIVLKYYDPITTVLLRLIISSAILFAGLKIFNRIQKLNKQDYKLFFLSALLNPFLYFLGENYGLQLTSPTISSIIIATIPLFTPILAFLVFGEKLSKLNIAGIFISFAGVSFMMLNKDLSFTADPKGVLWLSLAVIAAVVYSVLLKKLASRYDAFMIIAMQNVIGALYFLPFFLIFDVQRFMAVTPNAELISSLLLLSFFASSLAFVFFTISSREIGISKTNLFTNLIPVFTTIFSFFILREDFEARKIIGMVVVIGGVLLSQITGKVMLVRFYKYVLMRKKNHSGQDG